MLSQIDLPRIMSKTVCDLECIGLHEGRLLVCDSYIRINLYIHYIIQYNPGEHIVLAASDQHGDD